MRAYFNQLNQRERWTLGLGGLFTLFYFIYLLVFAPLLHAVDEKKLILADKQQTLIWMKTVKPVFQRQNHRAKQKLTPSALLKVFASALQKAKFAENSYQLQQTGATDIQLTFNQVAYPVFIKWFYGMDSQYVLPIKQFSMEKTSTAGVVKLNLILSGTM